MGTDQGEFPTKGMGHVQSHVDDGGGRRTGYGGLRLSLGRLLWVVLWCNGLGQLLRQLMLWKQLLRQFLLWKLMLW